MEPLSFYKCLADDIRLRCLLLVCREGELCVCELTAALAESQPKVSRHLARLRECGVLVDRRRGQWVYYALHPDLPAWSLSVLEETARVRPPSLVRDSRRLWQMGGRPARAMACG